jgi:hypothetical protein
MFNLVIAFDIRLLCGNFTLIRAWSVDLLSKKTYLSYGSNAKQRRRRQKRTVRCKHIVQESLKKFGNSGRQLSKRKKPPRNNPTFVETSFEVTTEIRKSDSNETITLVFTTLT